MRRGCFVARRHGAPLRGRPARRRDDLDDHHLIGRHVVGDVSGGGGKARGRLVAAFRDDSKRHPQGIHGAKGIHLSSASLDAIGCRHARIRRRARPALQPYLDQRLSHPRGRRDRRTRTRVYARRRHRVCSVGCRARAGHRSIRAAVELFL